MANFLPVPRIDTSLGLFEEEPLEDGHDINSLVAIERQAKRRSLPRGSATVAALRLEAGDPAQPSRGLGPDRDSAISACSPPKRQSPAANDAAIQGRFTAALAHVFSRDPASLSPNTLLSDLGASEHKAAELAQHCRHGGMAIDPEAVTGDKTVAQLQALVRLLSPDAARADASTSYFASRAAPSNSPASTAEGNPTPGSLQLPTPTPPPKAPERNAVNGAGGPAGPEATDLPVRAESPVEVRPKASRRFRNRVEQILSLNGDVSKASVTKPKAGFFEGQTVAFLTLASCVVEGPNDCEVRLQNPAYTGQLPAIRTAVEAKVSPNLMPDIWIVLEKMPQDRFGRVDRRKLQTWIQNANAETQRQILSIETGDTRSLPKNETQRRLRRAVSRVLKLEPAAVDMRSSFSKLGGDATAAHQLAVRCDSQGLSLHADDILQPISLTELAARGSLADESGALAEQSAGPFDLSPMQRLYFHSSMGRHHTKGEPQNDGFRFNQSVLLRLRHSVGVEDLRAAVETIVGHHPMLRCRFRRSGHSWAQHIDAATSNSYHFKNHTVRTEAELESVIRTAQQKIDIQHGPVFVAHHVHTLDGYQMLYLLAHHLAVDLKSWRVITDDLEELLANGSLVSGRSLSYRDWVQNQRNSPLVYDVAEGPAFRLPTGLSSYWGIRDDTNNYGNTTTSGFVLGSEVVSMLGDGGDAIKSRCADVFMAALLLSFSQVFRDRPAPAVWNQEHERATLDTERELADTVGWFTSLCPLAVDVSPDDDMFTVLCHVKESRRAVADRANAYFTASLMDAHSAASFAADHCPLELLFTFAGSAEDLDRHDAWLEQLPVPGKSLSSPTSDVGPNVGRIAVFEVSAVLDRDEAKFKFLYHKDMKHMDRVQSWIRACEVLLYETVSRLGLQSSELSLADIPLVDVSYEGLGHLKRSVLPSLNLNPANIEAIYPVTSNQQSILIAQSLVPGSSDLRIIYELESFDNQVDIGRICAAWQLVSDHNTALRTVFIPSVSRTGLYDQVILRRHSPSMLFLESELSDDALAYVERLPALPLTEGVPWHRLVVCQAPGRILLKLEISQALCDSRSLVALFAQLERAYFSSHDFTGGSRISYLEYIQCLKSTPCSTEFWKARLEGCQPCLFPVLDSRVSPPGDWINTPVDLQIFRHDLEKFASRYRVSLSTVFRVAWGLVLRVYVGSSDICFGYRTSGRDVPVNGLNDAVGAFSTVLISRFATPATQMISRLLLAAEEDRREALHHQQMTISDVEHALGTKGHRIFNTCLSFGFEDLADETDNNEFFYLKSERASDLDLNVDVDFHDARICITVGHRTISSNHATNVAHAFGRAIQTVMEFPNSTVKDVDLFNVNDHQQILTWNSMAKLDVAEEPVNHVIAEHASEYPDIQAICAWDGDLSYFELNELSLALAGHLLALGLTPETPVPVIMDKTGWAIVAMLAVLHAGAILVPVDAEAKSMIPFVLTAVNAGLVLVSDSVRKYVESPERIVVVVNKYTVPAMSAQAAAEHPAEVQPDDTACILFDLASPKTQKAITYSHGALATACCDQGGALLINPSSRVMQLSSYNTDISLSEIFTTLANGGCICVPSATERIEAFTSAAQRMRVNWTYLTPTLSRKLHPEQLPDMAVVCFRTRQLDSDTFAPWTGKVRVLLVYGSAEACPLGLSAAEVTDSSATRSIGSPFCGNYWIVSPEDNNRLMPVGAVGELVIGSPTLATEYDFKDHDIKNPRRNVVYRQSQLGGTSSRLLKTGHLVRYRDDGDIEFVSAGASHNAELEDSASRVMDIEPKLRRCLGRGVDVVVETIAFKDAESDPILAVFIELGDSLFDGREDLFSLSPMTKERLYLAKKMADMVLRETLPPQMVPSAYVPVKRLPLTLSLKVNRRELQRMITGLSRSQLLALAEVSDPSEVQTAALKPLPLTKAEQQVRKLWADTLGISENSITASDGFLSLGGDTVLAHQLVIASRRRGISLSIISVLRNLSLTELCRGIIPVDSPTIAQALTPSPSTSPARKPSARKPSPPKQAADEGSVPQIMGFGRKAFQDVAEASSLQTMSVESGLLSSRGNINYFLIHVCGSLDAEKLENACLMLTMAHPILRTAFVFHNRKVFQTVLRSFRSDFHRFECPSWRLGNLAAKLVKRDQSESVDLRDPITKFFFVDSGKSSILVMRLSRAQVDDVALPYLLKDLGRLYDRGGTTLRSGFCEVVRAAHETYSNGAEQYWRSLLEGASMTRIVAQNFPVIPTPNSKIVTQQVPTGSLQNLGIPFETVLKGGWSIVLSNLSGSPDVVFGQLVDGQRLTLSGGKSMADVVGPTGNIIPVRTRLPDAPITPYDYLKSVQTQHAASVPYENMQALDILERCTDWPAWMRFSTVVQHQGSSEREGPGGFTIGNATCKLDSVESNHQNTDVFVKSKMSGTTNVDISLTFNDRRIPSFFADEALKMLCSCISMLTSAFVREPLQLKGLNDSKMAPRIPLSASATLDTRLPAPSQPVSDETTQAVDAIVSTAWDAVLDAHALHLPSPHNVPFYDIWGSVVPAAELARYYTQNIPTLPIPGVDQNLIFSMDEMMEFATMARQHELIIAKLKTPQLKRNASITVRAANRWNKNIRRLAVGGIPTPTGGTSVSHVNTSNHKSSRSGVSIESIKTGSSKSDDEDLWEEASSQQHPPASSKAKSKMKFPGASG